MSIAKELKQKQTRIEHLEAELTAKYAEIAALAQTLSSKDAEIAAIVDQSKVALADAVRDGEESVAILNASLTAAQETIAGHVATIETLTAEKAKLTQALADPQYLDAIPKGKDTEWVEPGAEAVDPQPSVSHLEVFKTIEDPKERAAYYQAHEQDIKADMAKEQEAADMAKE